MSCVSICMQLCNVFASCLTMNRMCVRCSELFISYYESMCMWSAIFLLCLLWDCDLCSNSVYYNMCVSVSLMFVSSCFVILHLCIELCMRILLKVYIMLELREFRCIVWVFSLFVCVYIFWCKCDLYGHFFCVLLCVLNVNVYCPR